MWEHREERSQAADRQSRTCLVQIPWSKGTVCLLSRNKDKRDVGILKGTCYIIRWSGKGPVYISLPAKRLCSVQKTSVPLQKHTSPCSRHPLRVPTPALEAVLCSGIRHGSPISAAVPNGSYILKFPMAGKEGGRETPEAQQIFYCAMHLV